MSRSLLRSFNAMTRMALRSGAKAMKLASRVAKKARKPIVAKTASTRPRVANHPAMTMLRAVPGKWTTGMAVGVDGTRRYRLFKPTGVLRGERLPLVVMLHGCTQDAKALAASTKMNRLAQLERFIVLYPEQDRLVNLQNCWNWYDTRTGRAQREADSVMSAIDRICMTQPVDAQRMALVGLSAGAGMASLLAVRHPARFQAVVMHSGVGPGSANSTATALRAMHGRRLAVPPPPAAGVPLPALLVIQGNVDTIVAPSNGTQAAQLWADYAGARAARTRMVQRGKRYPALITDYRVHGHIVATLCLIDGLGHAWSGGASGMAYSDPKGPDASRMAWAFIKKQFATSARLALARAQLDALGGGSRRSHSSLTAA